MPPLLPPELLSLILTHTLTAALLTDDLPVHALAAEMTHGKLSYAGFITKTLDTRHHDALLSTSINLCAALPHHTSDVSRAWRRLVEQRRREAWRLHVLNARRIAEAGGEERLERQARVEVWEARLWIRMAARLRIDAGIWEEVVCERWKGEGSVRGRAEGMRRALGEAERREERSAAREREAAMRAGMRAEVLQEG